MTCCCNVLTGIVIASKVNREPPRPPQVETILKSVAWAGGNTTAELTFSMLWNSWSDLDFRLQLPTGVISVGNKRVSTGVLDVDMNIGSEAKAENTPKNSKPAVENIYFPKYQSVPDGEYDLTYYQYGTWHDRKEGEDIPKILIMRRTFGPYLDRKLLSESYVLIEYSRRANPDRNGQLFNIAKFNKSGDVFTLTHLAEKAVVKQSGGTDIKIASDIQEIPLIRPLSRST